MKYLLYFFFLVNPFNLFSTETQFITEDNYSNIWLWQLSNTTLTENQGIALSYDSTLNYKTPRLLWTGKKVLDNIYLGTADSASIIKLDSNYKEKVIYTNKEKSLVSAIALTNDIILASTSPESELISFNNKDEIITNIGLSNNYVWDIIPNLDEGFDIMTGIPAEVYHYSTNHKLSEPIDISNEEHILKGLYINNELWVLGEKALYKKQNDKFIAIASINGMATGFTYTNGFIYIISSLTPKDSANSNKQEVTSLLSKISVNGTIEELFSLQGFYFTAIDIYNDKIVIGGDQFGLYILYDINTSEKKFSSLGSGKILDIISNNNTLQILSSDPSGIWTIHNKLALEGCFISEVYDTKNLSSWGEFSSKFKKFPNTSIKFYIQSGVVEDPLYWMDWVLVNPGEKITIPNGRYIRYKAILNSDGNNSPYIYSVKFPYTQLNLSPIINSISIIQSNEALNISWDITDPNNDCLEYNLYLSEENINQKIKLNSNPITNTNYILPNKLFPSGDKRILIIASDRPSNSDSTALEVEYISNPITFDSDLPIISDYNITQKENNVIINFTINDMTSIIKEVSYFINGENQTYIIPDDKIFDSKSEHFTITIPINDIIFFQVHAKDATDNTSSKGITILADQ